MAEVGQLQLPYLTAERGLLLVRKHLSGYEQSEVARAIEIHNQSFRYFVFFFKEVVHLADLLEVILRDSGYIS